MPVLLFLEVWEQEKECSGGHSPKTGRCKTSQPAYGVSHTMNFCRVLPVVLGMALGAASLPATAQSVGRIRRSLDKATGGQTAPASPARPANPAPAATAAQTAAIQAAQNKRNAEAAVGADQRVVEFLKERVESGSAEAAFDLAKRYEEGKGVTADPKEARRLYALAAERGHEDAKTWLKEHPAPAKDVAAEKK